MAAAFKCDRCGVVAAEDHMVFFTVSAAQQYELIRPSEYANKVDLCSPCGDDFERFLGTPPVSRGDLPRSPA